MNLITQAAVASENVLCSDIGASLLKKGGSAVDAAIGTAICSGVTNMYSSGIGGGGFMVIRDKNGDSKFVDFREKAPAASTFDMYVKDPKKAQFGGTGFGVPGEIRGFETAHKLYGKLPWSELFLDSIKLCMDGFVVSDTLVSRMNYVPDLMLNNTAFREIFAPDGKILEKGQILKRVNYGKTLQEIADVGPSAFYEGRIAESMVKTARADGGIITLNDLKEYNATIQDTVEGWYHGQKVITAPPPTSGPVLLSVLNIMEGYNLQGEGRLIESYKHAFAQRGYYGDPVDTIYTNITQISKLFMEKQTAYQIRQNISDSKTFEPDHYKMPFSMVEDHGTMHVSVLSEEGEAVSMTCTVNLLFGGQIMDQETGIILNDEMDDFSIPGVPNAFGLEPSPYNFIQPGKRPLSSSVPTIVERNGKVTHVIGASGGSRIITATVQALSDMLDYNADPATALAHPRLHHQLLPNIIAAEWNTDPNIISELQARGHNVTILPEKFYLSGVELIRRYEDGTIKGDFRDSSHFCILMG
ncbi:nucleophile aminohydrolase [Phlyctochytrium arcticum]|nr:nucleophile aminohydrolase [Phlyctochytrium arcticum]